MASPPTSGAWAGKDHLFPIRVYYEDTDFSGFVYHASYVRFFERGRSEALRLAGITHKDMLGAEPPAAMVVRRMEIDYRLPLVIDDAVVVRSTMLTARGARLTIRQQIEREGSVCAEAFLEIALITPAGRPIKLSSDLLTKLEPFLPVIAP
jgi:acyl-CoA thioester hydrolase